MRPSWCGSSFDVGLRECLIQLLHLRMQQARIGFRAHVDLRTPTNQAAQFRTQGSDVVMKHIGISLIPVWLRPHPVPGMPCGIVDGHQIGSSIWRLVFGTATLRRLTAD